MGLKAMLRNSNRLGGGVIKSDQNGIESSVNPKIAYLAVKIKSDQNGIESTLQLRHIGFRRQIKSDQNGIERRTECLGSWQEAG